MVQNQRTDTKGLVRVEQRAADTADLGGTICRSVQTEAAEEGSGRRGAEQRRKVFSNAGREEEIDEEEGQETGEARQHTGSAKSRMSNPTGTDQLDPESPEGLSARPRPLHSPSPMRPSKRNPWPAFGLRKMKKHPTAAENDPNQWRQRWGTTMSWMIC